MYPRIHHSINSSSRRSRSHRDNQTPQTSFQSHSSLPLSTLTEDYNNYLGTSQTMPSNHNHRDTHSHHTHTQSHAHHIPTVHPKPRTRPAPDGTRILAYYNSFLHNNGMDNKKGAASDPYFDAYAGAEPGVNPRSGLAQAEYGHFKERCVIDIIDYDAEGVEFRRLSNEGMLDFLNGKHDLTEDDNDSEGGHAVKSDREDESEPILVPGDKQSLPPNTKVRWINIGGIDWEVLSLLAIRYNLHSLALEDILHERGHNHSKVDYYQGNIFIRILCVSLRRCREDETEPTSVRVASAESGISPQQSTSAPAEPPPTYDARPNSRNHLLTHDEIPSKEYLNGEQSYSMKKNGKSRLLTAFQLRNTIHFPLKRRVGRLSGYRSKAREKQIVQLQALTAGDRIEVNQEPVFIFLLRNGTVISIHPSPNLEYTSPISERLVHLHDSVLRTSEDASLLVQSLLDLVVDRALEMVDEYQMKISDLEHKILLGPSMQSVRSLHILSGDLIHHKRSLEPIKTLIYNLRRYDEERAMAVADQGHSVPPPTRPGSPTHMGEGSRGKGAPPEVGNGTSQGSLSPHIVSRCSSGDVVGASAHVNLNGRQVTAGYFSPKAKVYLADVYDHIDFALTSLDMFEDISENLINFAFNTASYEMNVVMNRLTLVTIIFLPLTLLTGYFGMNFSQFWSVENHSDLFFWKLAVPIMVALILLFMQGDIIRMYQKLRRRWNVRYALKASETSLKDD